MSIFLTLVLDRGAQQRALSSIENDHNGPGGFYRRFGIDIQYQGHLSTLAISRSRDIPGVAIQDREQRGRIKNTFIFKKAKDPVDLT